MISIIIHFILGCIIGTLICIGSMFLGKAFKDKSRSERVSALAVKQAQEARKQFGKGKIE